MSLIGAMIKTKESGKASRDKLLKTQEQRLKSLVKYAKENSPFYADLYKDIGEDHGLKDLPPVSKPEMMANFDEVLTDRSVSMKKIDEFTEDIENVGRLLDGKYLVFKTSGSTGNPAVVLYDKESIDVSSAVAALRTFARREDLKAFMRHGKKTAGVFANYGFYLACGMSRYMQLKMPQAKTKITVDVNAPEEQIVSELNAFGPAMLSGYPSNLALLADREDLRIKPDIVITGGELLTDSVRKKLKDKFGCYVQTHYSCTEGGEIACECSEGHLHINEDWVIVEPVFEDGSPVPSGQLSDKVFISNLANRVQPFIRYEITDRVIVHDEKCPCGSNMRWLEIEGRTDDTLVLGSIKIAPMSLYKILEEVKNIRRFQLIQTAEKELELRIEGDNPEEGFEKAKKELMSFLKDKGIEGVSVRLSDKKPSSHPVSGKFKHVYKDF